MKIQSNLRKGLENVHFEDCHVFQIRINQVADLKIGIIHKKMFRMTQERRILDKLKDRNFAPNKQFLSRSNKFVFVNEISTPF